MGELEFNARMAFEQLLNYGSPWSNEIVDVLVNLADINDDLQHGRSEECVRKKVEKGKALLDHIVFVEFK
jgi:hypothetical protein